MWLDPAHVKRDENENEGHNAQCDSNCQHFHGSVGVFLVLDKAEHTHNETEQDEAKQDCDDDFDN